MIMHMVDRMNDEYKRVEKSTVENHNNSRTMLEKGKSLLQSTREMVNISQKGKESVEKVKNIIDRLGD